MQSYDQSVFVSPHGYLQNYVNDLRQIFTHVSPIRGSVLLRRHCNRLCTSDFVDDVLFALNGPYEIFEYQMYEKFNEARKYTGITHLIT